MPRCHLIRVGAMSQVGRFQTVDATRYPRGSRVIVRTDRGLEVGEVLAEPDDIDGDAVSDGVVLRGMTLEDQLLEARLHQHRHAAYDACTTRLAALGLDVTLMDVEHLFDGRTVVFYFLGEQPPEVEQITRELAEAYDAEAQVRRFADLLTQGCGPGCGTEHATGAGCGSCGTGCAVADACSTRNHHS